MLRYYALYGYHLVYFVSLGFSLFAGKFYAEIGLSDPQIGLLTSIPTFISLLITPLIGSLTDRISKKRYMLTFMLVIMAACCLLVKQAIGNYYALLACITGYTVGYNAINSVFTTISLEYSAEIGKPYGPIRLCGTLGYQLGELMVGYILSVSLKSLYPLMGAGLIAAAGVSLMMPNVRGYQYNKKKVPFYHLFKNRKFVWLYCMTLIPGICNAFYSTFFTKHLGDLGMNNTTVSWITMLSIVLEVPFLYFGDRIAKKTNVWNWVLIGMAVNGLHLLGLSFLKAPVPIIIVQQLAVSVLACNEFIPALYLTKHLPPELLSTGQSFKTFVNFGVGRIIGSMAGGLIADKVGIPSAFLVFSMISISSAVIFYLPTRRLIRQDEDI